MYNTRYWFLKKLYPHTVLLFKTSKNKLGYRCYGIDRYILDGIRNYTTDIKVILKRLNYLKINYLLIVDLRIIMSYDFLDDNQYTKYLYRFIVNDILDRIRVCVFR